MLDELIAHQLLRVLEPAALELSLRAAEDNQQERDCLHQHWRQRLERAGYEADRATRQYHAVEPENRLVARQLERRWEESLHEQRESELVDVSVEWAGGYASGHQLIRPVARYEQ